MALLSGTRRGDLEIYMARGVGNSCAVSHVHQIGPAELDQPAGAVISFQHPDLGAEVTLSML